MPSLDDKISHPLQSAALAVLTLWRRFGCSSVEACRHPFVLRMPREAPGIWNTSIRVY